MDVVRRLSLVVMLGVVLASVAASAQEKASALAGKWTGSVKADIGEMPIEAVFQVDGEKFSGEIKTFHGGFAIATAERQKDGRWKLPFKTADGASGALIGALKGDTFSGDWDFSPNAVGKFTLTKVK